MNKIMMFQTTLIFVWTLHTIFAVPQPDGMFIKTNWLKNLDTSQLNYGVAVSDVDNDGSLEWIVAGFSGPNFVLKFDRATKRLINLAQDHRYSANSRPRRASNRRVRL